ncbi:MAG: helix-turn-helix transcriptional regulator [Pirellulales bacterium]|nr:helix-turn-helix transcriptional regulator [Pirellulales bacterium]
MGEQVGENLRRVMAQAGLSLQDVAQKTGLDRRTVSAILDGRHKPHARTLHRLAQGLDVSVAEFLLRPAPPSGRPFDVHTNPAVDETFQAHPELFAGWTATDFEDLYSRFGAGGPLTSEGTLQTIGDINRRRQLQEKLALLLESHHADLIGAIVELLYREVVVSKK